MSSASNCLSRAAPAAGFALAAMVVAVSGCSTARTDLEWSSPDLGARSGLLRGSNVLIACEAPDVAIRNVCQDQLAGEVAKRGGKPVFVAEGTRLTTDRSLDEQLLPSARTGNARAILVVALRPAVSEASGSGLSLGIGGFGFGRNSALGVGVGGPVGGTRVETGFAASGRVTDVSTGRLVWTANASAPPSDDLRAQFSDLAVAVLNSAERAGLF